MAMTDNEIKNFIEHEIMFCTEEEANKKLAARFPDEPNLKIVFNDGDAEISIGNIKIDVGKNKQPKIRKKKNKGKE